jgi:hypothetical protein
VVNCDRFAISILLAERYGRWSAAGTLQLDFEPLGHLLPLSALLVHHGGIGTTARALQAGIAQVVVPFAFDQPDNAVRVEALGAGRCTPALELAVAQESASRQTSAPMIGNCVPVPDHYHVEGFIADELTGDLSVRLERAGVTLVDESRPLSYTEFRPNGPECEPVCGFANLEVALPGE